ncbi:DNA methyltransferase [Paracoccus sp. S-4012]|uniref:DNA methyltransferase n=1 Tax=Paracoccus sp. S-4012 TaxID=2665648 RepID=UPI001E3C28FC|nr:DNA methyltransferase [Paracoccus sp. S-4012]
MSAKERRASGAHYTTEKNIMKVIEPLFLDDLRAEFARLRARKDSRRRVELQAFHNRLSKLTFFDPACGCGNFLVIAYRELRQLEQELLLELRAYREDDRTMELDAADLSKVDVGQFYGIEIGEFASRIAETAMWMMDHIMNTRLSLAFGQSYSRIPLRQSPHILHADALETDWATLLPPERCSFILGNPPFIGSKYQSHEQRAQVRRIATLGKSGGTLDFVAAWFILAGRYAKARKIRIGFVSTNSLTQGEQVAQLWPILFNQCRLEIAFAHRTFAWGSDARGKARVHVVILGLDPAGGVAKEKRLFSYDDLNGDPVESRHSALSPYLFDASRLNDPHLVVREAFKPLNSLPTIISGSQPIDGGFLIFNKEERTAFLALEPAAKRYMRPFIGTEELLYDSERSILALQSATPAELKAMPRVVERLRAVKASRLRSKRPSTLAIAEKPTKFNVETIPDKPFLVIPEVSSERRDYIPIARLKPPAIPSNKIQILPGATKPLFALLTSAMHMAWVRYIGGRLESRYQYGIGVVYHTFPPPPASADMSKLTSLAEAVLVARASYPDSTLADLYDPDLMPLDLRRAHQALDRAVDRLYAPKGFTSDRERAEHLFGLYEKMIAPLTAAPKPKRRGARVSA